VDVFGTALAATAQHSPIAWPLAFGVGVLSSAGPCAAPRTLAFVSLVLRSTRPRLLSAVFLGAMFATYAALGLAGSLISHLLALSTWIYIAVAITAVGGGVWSVVSAGWCADDRVAPDQPGSIGAAFFSGAGFALMISPCCTPFVAAAIAYTTLVGQPLTGAGLLVVFGVGHAVPIYVVAAGGGRFVRALVAYRLTQAAQIVSGACMLVIGAYYALLV